MTSNHLLQQLDITIYLSRKFLCDKNTLKNNLGENAYWKN